MYVLVTDYLPRSECVRFEHRSELEKRRALGCRVFDENRRGEFMDSYGLNPDFYNFDSFMNENATTWSGNSKSIQNPLSVVGGHYCVYYILYRCRDVLMKQTLSPFTSNVVRNDLMIKKFIHHNFNIKIDHRIDQFLSW